MQKQLYAEEKKQSALDDDDECLIDVENFNAKKYILHLLTPFKVISY